MEMKNICGKIPLDLHEKVREEIERTESSTQKFIQQVIEEHFNGKGEMSEMVKHFCNTNTEKISLYYEYLFSNGVRYPFDECGRI